MSNAKMNSTIRCTDCGTQVELTRQPDRTLTLTCDCGDMRSIKVATRLPEGWE